MADDGALCEGAYKGEAGEKDTGKRHREASQGNEEKVKIGCFEGE